MRKLRLTCCIGLVVFVAFACTGLAAATPPGCVDGVQSSGALYRICMPNTNWNGDLILWAHGYVAFNQPLQIPDDSLPLPNGGTISVSQLVNDLGFAYATTSYSANGLAVLEGMGDLADLVNLFTQAQGQPNRVFLVGASEGGLITALSIEQRPQFYTGGLAACGPIGSFRQQVNYLGNFRVLFNYFFPGVVPGSAVSTPVEVMQDWDSVYVPKIISALQAKPLATAQLLNVSKAPIGSNPANIDETVTGLLWYNVFATSDAEAVLGGQPFDNSKTIYHGSLHDKLLNILVPRYTADPAALATMSLSYTTLGVLTEPLVTIHTTGDPIIPYWHEEEYNAKAQSRGSGSLHANIPIFRYGHCNFKASEALVAFGVLLAKTGAPVPTNFTSILQNEQSLQNFLSLGQKYGLVVK